MPGLKQERWNAKPRNGICQILKLKARDGKLPSIPEAFFRKSRQLIYLFTGGNISQQGKEGHKVHLWDKMHIWLLVITSIKAKSQVKRCTVYISHLYCSVFLYAFCKIHFFFVAVLCDHLPYMNILIWINIFPITSETVNCIGYPFLHVLLLITCDKHSVLQPGELLIQCPNASFSIFKGTFKGQACFTLQDYYWQPPTKWVKIPCNKTKFIHFFMTDHFVL